MLFLGTCAEKLLVKLFEGIFALTMGKKVGAYVFKWLQVLTNIYHT